MLAARAGLARGALSLSIVDASTTPHTGDRLRKRSAFWLDRAGSGRPSTPVKSEWESWMRPPSEGAIEGGVKTPLSCLTHLIPSSPCLSPFSSDTAST